jgi:hypothetical protein
VHCGAHWIGASGKNGSRNSGRDRCGWVYHVP